MDSSNQHPAGGSGLSPMDMLFRSFVLDTIGALPPQQQQALEALDLGAALKIDAADWRTVLKQALHLSDTIEVAILDLWYTNAAAAAQRGAAYAGTDFAADFVAAFYAPDSRVDVWEGDALAQAKARIAARTGNGGLHG